MISAIYDRRSIRKFSNKPISPKDITDIIQSGIKAPSSKKQTTLEIHCDTRKVQRRDAESFPSGN